MNVEILCIGTLKEAYLRDGEAEYLKRLTPFCKLSVTELKEVRLPKNASAAEEAAVREREGAALLAAAAARQESGGTFAFALDARGRQLSSEKFAARLEALALTGKSTILFFIGGSLGLSESVRQKSDAVLSFSEMTFPHQLMRVILLEQLYRAQKILRGEPYHK